MWTADTAAAIQHGNLPAHAQRLTEELLQVRAACTNQVQGVQLPAVAAAADTTPRVAAACLQVVDRVRGQLSSLERKVLSALIVIDVHARDVAAELAAKGVSSDTDFDFISQLR